MSANLRIAVIGAGMGGLVAAAALRTEGFDVHVYEQAPKFTRLGAGIQMGPNAMRVLRGLGLEERIRATAFRPNSWKNREWDSGDMHFELPLGDVAEEKYGAPYLLMHRGDLHEALASLIPADGISLNKQLVSTRRTENAVEMTFADGSTAKADALIGADGVHSVVRKTLLGEENPEFTGRVAYRAVFPASLLSMEIDECTKWWGEDRHIVIYYTTANRDEVYFTTSLPEPDWTRESWSATGDVNVLRDAFSQFHPQVCEVLRACPQVHKWALADRTPFPKWSGNRMAILGDAAHPVVPYMAQGAAMAMEDGIMLSRCLSAQPDDIDAAFNSFEGIRKERASRVQRESHANKWMREETDPSWCYGYDVWTDPIVV